MKGQPEGIPGSPLAAGLAYIAMVFALGFVLGTMRTLLVHDSQGAGRLLGVLIELPIMLAASWFLCSYLVRRFRVAAAIAPRAIMGGVAFAVLLLAELLVGAALFGRTPAGQLALYREASYAIGLTAQCAFALMPLAQLRQAR